MKSVFVFMIVATISAVFSGQPTGTSERQSVNHEAVWRQSGIEAYEYTLEYRTSCDYSQVRITVDPSVRFSQMTVLTGHIPPEVYQLSSVEKLFRVVERYADSNIVRYDAEHGFPVEIEREFENGDYCKIWVMDFEAQEWRSKNG